MSEREPVVMFSDYACPWCYLGRARLLRAIEPDRPSLIRPFPLSPDTPPEGRDIVEHLRAKGIDVTQALARLIPLMQEEGLEYPTDLAGRRQYSTRRAQELALWAQDHGTHAQLEALHDRLFRAYQVENLDVYSLDVLERLATEVGLDGGAGRVAIERGDYASAREQAWRVAMQAGITGVPTYVVGQQGVMGAQPVEVLRRLLAG
ncbi:2-hydroxychromene-2-carboxylate isomerase/DsbA-like thioredoxin domain [Enhygromyxa salina]|uniref:2-hydroxychromene-2-carboxylate isomerase/DsbA-like thioredoxin domain n=1 Tax=Enhygromyxa salina TaxID=215803 RepID=A0A0C2A7K5_9BACT|nr:DsbA family oxidoreductase [Enhygromyxa salina]KIG19553.1 2-hydroxychromene-2-carboxylate isomerase/DsbA-like thioredoxin domain [Enhygromyxa salina]